MLLNLPGIVDIVAAAGRIVDVVAGQRLVVAGNAGLGFHWYVPGSGLPGLGVPVGSPVDSRFHHNYHGACLDAEVTENYHKKYIRPVYFF